MSSRRQTPLVLPAAEPHACTPELRRRALSRVPFFAHLDGDDLARIDERFVVRDYRVGSPVYLAGQPAERLYVVALGTAKLTRATAEGDEVLLDALRQGDFLGGAPAFGQERYTETAWPLSDACLLSLDAGGVEAVLERYPSVAREGIKALGRRLERAQAAVFRLQAATAEQRVALALQMLAERLGIERGGQTVINAPLGRDELASLAGCAPETASRILARLDRDGVVEAGRRWVGVRDTEALAALAAGQPRGGAQRG